MSQRMYLSQIALLQQKVVHLQADNIIYEQQVGRLRRRVIELEQYRIKYQLLVQKQTQQSPLDRSRRVDEINNMNKRIEENNLKWMAKVAVLEGKYVGRIQELEKEVQRLNSEIKVLEEEKIGINNKTRKNIDYQQELTKLTEQIKQLRIKNIQLNNDNTQQKQANQHLQQIITSIKQNLLQKQQKQQQFQQKLTQAKQQQKQFYRQTILKLQQQIQQLKKQVQYHKVRASPQRQMEISRLEQKIVGLEEKQLREIIRFTQLIKQKDDEINGVRELLGVTKAESHKLVTQLQQKLKQSQQQNFNLKHEHHFELITCRQQLQTIHQQQTTQLKQSFTLLQHSFQKQRQQWQLILNSQSQQLQRIKSQWQQDKQKYMQQKAKLKQKIQDLKAKIKENQQEEKLKVQQQTKQLLENIKLVDDEESKFSDYENGIVFLHRQLKKSMVKVQEKQRQIGQLLNELKTQRDQFQQQVQFIKKTQRSQVAYYKQKLLQTDQQNAKLLSQIRDKQKYLRAKDQQHKGIYQKLTQENQSLRNMMEQMERDYRRLTENKRELYQSYRSQRDLVFTGKSQLNQQRKNKWLHLARQKNQLQIAYKEREKQLRNQYQLQINTLNQQLHKINMEKQQSATQLQILKQKDENEGNVIIDKKEKSEKNMKQFHKKLASLDLQINLTQNLYATINSLKARKNKRNEIDEISMKSSSQDGMDENEQNIHQMRDMSMNSQEMQKINTMSPTFSLNQNMRQNEGLENFSFYPQQFTVKVSQPLRKKNNHSEVSFDPSKDMFENQQYQ